MKTTSHSITRFISSDGRKSWLKTIQRPLRAGCLLAPAMLLVAQSALAVSLPFTETFDTYTNGINITAVGGGSGTWNGGGSTKVQVQAGDVTGTVYDAASAGKHAAVAIASTGSTDSKFITFAGQTGNMYASFYITVTTGPSSSDRPILGFDTGTSQITSSAIQANSLGIFLSKTGGSGQFFFGLRKGGSAGTISKTSTTNTANATNAYFVIVERISNAATNDDECRLWVNPVSEGTGYITNADASVIDATNIQSFHIESPGSSTAYRFDNLKVGTSWSDVGGPPTGPCVPPGITNQPVAQTVCAGDTAVFTVGVTNSGLVYQWSKNGVALTNGATGNGSTYSGVSAATLSISGVAIADAALTGVGFDCVITNGCGTTNSTRVALSVNTAPAAFGVTGGGSYCSGGGGVAVGLAGSESGVSYYLRLNGVNNGITTNGTGSALSFGNQTAAGTYTVIATNGTGCSALMTTNAVVAINSQPGITTEPVAATTAVGGSATFTVVATGGSLTYQWNKNGSTISTATNASYTIYPAALGDAALAANGYDCIITGPCGSTNSARVALTVNAASDLIWAGDGAANLWNTLGAANWSNGVSLVQFTSGDRVTFDDSSANPVVNLPSTQIPTSATVNSASNYVFAGSGAVGGSLATVAKSGTGSLTIIGAQTYGGGTVISNGTLAISNNASLGTGTATLAGGSLTTLRTLSLANGINATATSSLTYNGTGDSALVLNGTFNVAGGTTLTITHAGAGPDRLRIFDTNTTVNGDIVFNGAGIAFACYSASGTQTFNGIISGNGQVMRRTANAGVFGTTIFNGNNTYSGNTTLTDGVIGFGLSSTGDPVTAGPVGTGTLAFVDSTSTPSVRTLFASGGARTVGNPVTIGGAQTNRINGANDLTLAGTINLGGATRAFEVNNTSKTIFANVVSNGGLTKNGTGALYLNGTNTYTGPTTVNAGTLGGTGILASAVTVAVGGNLAPGASIGTLTVSNDVTLSGTFTVEVDTSASPNCDRVVGISNVVFGGTLAIVNTGPALTASNTFQIFSALTYNGAFASITPATPGASLAWNTNTLTTDGTLRITSTGGASSDANLSGLVVLPAGTLSPAFDSNTTTYAASEANANSPITVTPTSADAGAVIQVIYGGATNVVTSGNPSGPLALDANPSVPNVAQVRVTAADTTTVKSYTVTVTRQPSLTPPTLTKVSSGGNLTMSWPLDHTGWTLQTQTNSRSVGLTMPTNTWFDVAGSTATNLMVIPISSGNPTVFYRLMLFLP